MQTHPRDLAVAALFELDTAAIAADNRGRGKPSSREQRMRNVLMTAAALAALSLAQSAAARANEFWPAIPPEQGITPVVRPAAVPWRCAEEPVYNFYHGAWYREPPAVYRGNTYRPFYRYAAWRLVPRTYFCEGR